MSKCSVVIGAGFGDEGKGLITDFETRRLNANLVGRFNGGAQAGHTVTTNEGRRHVFGHVAAGTFAGASTYLSSKFIFNPLVLTKEIDALGFAPNIYVNADAPVTTIYDMVLNSLAEISRGGNRHGSCGLGINETVTRHEFYPLYASEIYIGYHSLGEIANLIKQIREEWVTRRLSVLGITDIPEPYTSVLKNDDYHSIAKEMLRGLTNLKSLVVSKPSKSLYNDVVLEGAQGLMLDEYMGKFPHVTRSITGLPYALIAAQELGLKSIKPIYVTRSYTTRHGAGPLSYENEPLGFQPSDKTNVENQWQQKLRFAPLNIPDLRAFIYDDMSRGVHVARALGITIEPPTIAVTCLDQIGNEQARIVNMNKLMDSKSAEELPQYIQRSLNLKVSHVSHGPTANDVEYLGD